jgi:hypothetical protein
MSARCEHRAQCGVDRTLCTFPKCMSEETAPQGYCFPSLGEPCGDCHRCQSDPEAVS